MLGQQKSVIVCAEMAKGKRANMQDIYHPRRGVRVRVCVNLCVYTEAHKTLSACARMSAFEFIDQSADTSTAKSTETMYNTIALTLSYTCTHTRMHARTLAHIHQD